MDNRSAAVIGFEVLMDKLMKLEAVCIVVWIALTTIGLM